MFVFRHGGRRAITSILPFIPRTSTLAKRCYASRIDVPFTPPPVPVIDQCPSPTCQCRESPPGLDIEREQDLNGSMPTYAEQVLISTGRSNWPSKIDEDEGEDSALVRQLRKNLLRDGKYSDPYHNIMLTNSSIPPTESPSHHNKEATPTPPPASAFLLPSFQYVPTIPTDPPSVEDFIKAFVLPAKLHKIHNTLSRAQQNILLRQPDRQKQFPGARPINEILILICGHGNRDARCGTLGPILQAEFEDKLQRQNIAILRDPPVAEAEVVDTAVEGYVPTARVGLISHIGGHKWAGNVIVYIPPSFQRNSLAGKGIWYGRVGPEHVEGIVGKTVLDGKVIKELFRGGIDGEREVIRL
ncbi:Altered inheritance of mitochondria protein 32 [Friedmanniomyces endolithicus]|uniref:Altered inheritance of mitochondria protein 32 n=2 Tax=Dothideomycetidae TaxID=451867 RepID=A0AAN6QYV3_9PEZI|nr:Altered inheritance of mitochondria protein 32 [Friedmanniomyces endolithicus]KAK5142448.1 Altered inheritance of mitochondria protein 32 [Rachicladosporium monterosium]KAK0789332.1 Altered inheritance of mitochondria protein 32 [Friedmanniomyces endolithicus]KAK0800094.1 Altered inheritance of mitochondria protein 32 [Friedmanniomyces endolithicus]KAK0868276.1 Altered inheritance of mitochondria protein 32 [Friedmanniomyces endolithicus]